MSEPEPQQPHIDKPKVPEPSEANRTRFKNLCGDLINQWKPPFDIDSSETGHPAAMNQIIGHDGQEAGSEHTGIVANGATYRISGKQKVDIEHQVIIRPDGSPDETYFVAISTLSAKPGGGELETSEWHTLKNGSYTTEKRITEDPREKSRKIVELMDGVDGGDELAGIELGEHFSDALQRAEYEQKLKETIGGDSDDPGETQDVKIANVISVLSAIDPTTQAVSGNWNYPEVA